MSTAIIDNLYHYTNYVRYFKIMRSGVIMRSPSCLYDGNLTFVYNRVTGEYTMSDLEHDHIKPVVWLTNSKSPNGHGIPNEKAQLRITVKPNDSVEWWMKWQRGNHMKKNWFKQFTKGKDYYSWYVSETDIPVSDILIVEDIVTGEVIYFKEQEQN